jgi:iron complex outermembrane receptor protein
LVPDNADGDPLANWPAGPKLNNGGPGPFFQNVTVENESRAVFANATWQFSDNWKLDIGARYTEDDRAFNNIEFGTICDLPDTLDVNGFYCEGGIVPLMDVLTVIDGGFFNEGSETFTAFTPMASLTYNLPGENGGIVYGLFSEGFLTGGFNTEVNSFALAQFDLLTYEPEQVLNYELGYKGRILNEKVEISSAIFYMDYTNQQDQQQVDNSTGLLGADDTVGITQNVSSSSIYGLELELRAVPWDGGFVTLDVGYLKNEYATYSYIDVSPTSPTFGETLDFSDNLIHDYTPEWKVNLAVDHQFQIGNGGTLTPRLNLHWETGYDFAAGFGWTESDPKSSCYRDSYMKADARVTYAPASGAWQLAALGGNITDERIIEFCDSHRSVWRTRLERPRYFGLEFSSNFGF